MTPHVHNRSRAWLTHKLTRSDLRYFCERNATGPDDRVLIVHADDMPFDHLFPNRTKAHVSADTGDVQAEDHYQTIHADSDSYDVIVCTGLLEHVPTPRATIAEMGRVLRSGGKLLISASASFSVHNAPKNYFQFTEYGMAELLSPPEWETVSVYPSCRPFRAVAILLQRICYQTSMNRMLKLLILLLVKGLPVLDKTIRQSYGDISKSTSVRSMLYSNVQAVAVKA